ncbi:MAG: RES family NAD+ phosphorylase [Gammaproteobacteria bacterium]|nr:RES family NAD+ phosphorylase [Gammaproteobacteria bacterium]
MSRLNVVDLADPANRSIIDTTPQELTGDWRGYRTPHAAPAPTQALAHAVHQALPATHGILAPSARNPSVSNLIVFHPRGLAVTPT